ncbi:class IIb bacteriocin, lactobin A/cerein 7B family [Aliiglaciecola litoralis]|uniref:Class IIb bacteriocin, lactobin A/cerein 7B family n=1 Tax=Aliiglaciecola litoralis TaxID=582857 RepID=A0ABP3WT46_9ALTE
MNQLTNTQLEQVSGGFICGGLCVLGAISAGAVLFASGITVGNAMKK